MKRNTAAFCALGALALPGIASIALIVPELLHRASGAHPLPMPVPLLTAIAIAQVALLTAVAIAVGLATAPRAGLHSAIVQRVHGEPAGRIDAILGTSAGVALAAALWIADRMCSNKAQFQGFSLSITAAGDAEAKRVFDALAQGGKVQVPLTPAFFATSFGIVADKFGVSWMVYAPVPTVKATQRAEHATV